MTAQKRTKSAERLASKRIGNRRLEKLIKEAIVDAYSESEQRVGFLTMLEEKLAVPFNTEVLETTVSVERVDLDDAEEIVALCRRGKQRQTIPILSLPAPSPLPAAGNWLRLIVAGRAAGKIRRSRGSMTPPMSACSEGIKGGLARRGPGSAWV